MQSHHLRGESTASRISGIAHIYTNLVHNLQLSISVQTLRTKMTFNKTDPILARDAAEGEDAIPNAMLWFCTNRLTSMVTTVQSIIIARLEQKNDDDLVYDFHKEVQTDPRCCVCY